MRVGSSGSDRNRRHAYTPMAEINIIPLVDVTLVLLIIFMATTAFVKDPKNDEVRELPLHLPASAAATVNPTPEAPLILAVDKEGNHYVGTEAVTTTALRERVRAAATQNPQRRVRIDANQDTRFQDVVEVIELCEFEGLNNVGIHTAPEKP